MNTSLSLGLATFIAMATLGGCAATTPVAPASPAALAPAPSAIVADAGNGQVTPASINFRVALASPGRYSLKNSSAGVAAKTLDDLTTIKFYLIASNTGSPPTGLAGNGFSYSLSGTNKTNGFVDVTFTNVAANDPGQSYYVVVAGFSSYDPSADDNITNLAAPINDGPEGKYFISNTGGSPAGGLRVTPTTYAISGTGTLGIPLKLLDAVSPVIESSVNLTVGDEVTGPPSPSVN